MTSIVVFQKILVETSKNADKLRNIDSSYHSRLFIYTNMFYYNVEPKIMDSIRKHFGGGHKELYIIHVEKWLQEVGVLIPYDE